MRTRAYSRNEPLAACTITLNDGGPVTSISYYADHRDWSAQPHQLSAAPSMVDQELFLAGSFPSRFRSWDSPAAGEAAVLTHHYRNIPMEG